VKICHAANKTLINKLPEPIYREEDIPILLEAGAIEVRRYVTHNQVIGCDVPRDDLVLSGPGRERPITASV
jgi:hypothetical protein